MQYNIIANRRNVETSYSALYKLPGQHDALKKKNLSDGLCVAVDC